MSWESTKVGNYLIIGSAAGGDLHCGGGGAISAAGASCWELKDWESDITLVSFSLPAAAAAAAVPAPSSTAAAARCQVEGCTADLSSVLKEYHRRHKVCEMHSKTPNAVVGGREQRFCQQCSRFHLLSEFDEGKRSCRRRLAGHNERRRKPPPPPATTSYYAFPYNHHARGMPDSGCRPNTSPTSSSSRSNNNASCLHDFHGSTAAAPATLTQLAGADWRSHMRHLQPNIRGTHQGLLMASHDLDDDDNDDDDEQYYSNPFANAVNLTSSSWRSDHEHAVCQSSTPGQQLQQVGGIKDGHPIFSDYFYPQPNRLLSAFLQSPSGPCNGQMLQEAAVAALNASPDVTALSSCWIPLGLHEFVDGGAKGQNLSLMGGWGSTELYHNQGYCDHSQSPSGCALSLLSRGLTTPYPGPALDVSKFDNTTTLDHHQHDLVGDNSNNNNTGSNVASSTHHHHVHQHDQPQEQYNLSLDKIYPLQSGAGQGGMGPISDHSRITDSYNFPTLQTQLQFGGGMASGNNILSSLGGTLGLEMLQALVFQSNHEVQAGMRPTASGAMLSSTHQSLKVMSSDLVQSTAPSLQVHHHHQAHLHHEVHAHAVLSETSLNHDGEFGKFGSSMWGL
ncbi:unnamed protein product [Sphagnum troendelagicum]|uniref:SBP-type domain-containing protein n=1 Tax=Sphagnum troendelagicum TaxID=128251 RepID=A0ABP0V597_9BRYO